jgi:four helix bundle protein
MEVDMPDNTLFPHQRTDVYVAAKRLVELIVAAKIGNPNLKDQAERAAMSVFLQIAEGLPSDSVAMRRKYFTTAKGSLYEVVAATDLARSIGKLDGKRWSDMQETASRVRAMLIGLLRND